MRVNLRTFRGKTTIGLLLAMACSIPMSSLHGQEQQPLTEEMRRSLLEELVVLSGRSNEVPEIETLLRESQRKHLQRVISDAAIRDEANRFAMMLGIHRINAVQASGLDVSKYAFAITNTTPRELAAMSDLVVVATLVDGNVWEPLPDGNRSVLKFRVDEHLSGADTLAYVTIREGSGLSPDGIFTGRSNDILPKFIDVKERRVKTGSQWLLFLSKGVFKYRTVERGADPSAVLNLSSQYAPVILPQQLVGDTLVKSSHSVLSEFPTLLSQAKASIRSVSPQ